MIPSGYGVIPGLRFSASDAERAAAWGFNCGPAALCAALELTPDELRPHLGDFEAKGFMNPTMVKATLRALKQRTRTVRCPQVHGRASDARLAWPLGVAVVAVQWDGRWCDPGVPAKARYCYTHWVARCGGLRIFDINAFTIEPAVAWSDWWLSRDEWADELVPRLLPKGARGWYLFHTIELR